MVCACVFLSFSLCLRMCDFFSSLVCVFMFVNSSLMDKGKSVEISGDGSIA